MSDLTAIVQNARSALRPLLDLATALNALDVTDQQADEAEKRLARLNELVTAAVAEREQLRSEVEALRAERAELEPAVKALVAKRSEIDTYLEETRSKLRASG